MENSKHSQYIIQKLQTPSGWGSERTEGYAKWAKRILWMDDNVVNGAFQMNCSWYLRPPLEKTAEASAHTHSSNELLGFFGGNPEQPYDLGAEIEFWMEDEKIMITQTSMIFIPKGMLHCPIIIRKVDRPFFHFSALTEGQYLRAPGKST